MVKKKRSVKPPDHILPMLCTLVTDLPADKKYLYEIKWDGYRILSSVFQDQVRMSSRSGLDYTNKYPPVAEALASLGHDVLIDGEVVVFNELGVPDFDALQKYNGHNTPISYCVFDLLWLNGENIMHLPLVSRRDLLKSLIDGLPVFLFSESFDEGKALFNQVLERNLEGVVAKDRQSEYIPGERGRAWLKIPTRKRQEFVIGGYADSDKSRAFRSLLFGDYENGKFIWRGRSGGGFKEKDMAVILKQLQALEIKESPFANKVLDTKGATIHWIKPKLVAIFEFATWTKSGRIRKPATFLGFRKDKKATQVVHEVPKETNRFI